jgi:hypothetical protein
MRASEAILDRASRETGVVAEPEASAGSSDRGARLERPDEIRARTVDLFHGKRDAPFLKGMPLPERFGREGSLPCSADFDPSKDLEGSVLEKSRDRVFRKR